MIHLEATFETVEVAAEKVFASPLYCCQAWSDGPCSAGGGSEEELRESGPASIPTTSFLPPPLAQPAPTAALGPQDP
eukprot:5162853-Pyramimonas_sp.AAC.1